MAATEPEPVRPQPPRRPLSPWVPVLLVALALLTLIGGLSVADFYWHDLRPDMGRIGSNLAEVRDRQRTMMGNFAEAQVLLLEQQRRLVAQAQDLRQREQAVYEARLEIEAQRAQLAQGMLAEAQRQREAATRLGEAADRAATAAEGLTRDDRLDEAQAAIDLTRALLAPLPGTRGDPGRASLAEVESSLAQVRPVDRSALIQRLASVQGRAAALRPVAARLLREQGQTAVAAAPRQRREDPVTQAARSLDSQFQAARVALEGADAGGFRVAMQGIEHWLAAFYEPRMPDTAAVLTQVRALAQTQTTADLTPLAGALTELAAVLRSSAEGDK